MPVQVRARFYRELLTPVLHRRFTRAASLMLLVCYVDSIIIGHKSSSTSPSFVLDEIKLILPFPSPMVSLSTWASWVAYRTTFHIKLVNIHPTHWATSSRCSLNGITLSDFQTVFLSIQYSPDIRLVLFLSMVVQRSIPMVSVD